jgi:hypothetical protein
LKLAPFALEMITELNAGSRIARQELAQLVSPLNERLPAQILTIEKQQIECEQHQAMRRTFHASSQRCEVCSAVGVLHNHLAINEC